MENTYVVFGAGSGVGFHFVSMLRRENKSVYALIRSEAHEGKLLSLGVKIVKGDAMNMTDIEKIFTEASSTQKNIITVSTINNKKPNSDERADDQGNINVITQAKRFHAKRFLLVTSIGCGEMMATMSKQAMDAFGDALKAKTKAENFLKESALPYTILRPGGLLSEPAIKVATMIDHHDVHRYIHHENMAILMIQTLQNPKTIEKTLA